MGSSTYSDDDYFWNMLKTWDHVQQLAAAGGSGFEGRDQAAEMQNIFQLLGDAAGAGSSTGLMDGGIAGPAAFGYDNWYDLLTSPEYQDSLRQAQGSWGDGVKGDNSHWPNRFSALQSHRHLEPQSWLDVLLLRNHGLKIIFDFACVVVFLLCSAGIVSCFTTACSIIPDSGSRDSSSSSSSLSAHSSRSRRGAGLRRQHQNSQNSSSSLGGSGRGAGQAHNWIGISAELTRAAFFPTVWCFSCCSSGIQFCAYTVWSGIRSACALLWKNVCYVVHKLSSCSSFLSSSSAAAAPASSSARSASSRGNKSSKSSKSSRSRKGRNKGSREGIKTSKGQCVPSVSSQEASHTATTSVSAAPMLHSSSSSSLPSTPLQMSNSNESSAESSAPFFTKHKKRRKQKSKINKNLSHSAASRTSTGTVPTSDRELPAAREKGTVEHASIIKPEAAFRAETRQVARTPKVPQVKPTQKNHPSKGMAVAVLSAREQRKLEVTKQAKEARSRALAKQKQKKLKLQQQQQQQKKLQMQQQSMQQQPWKPSQAVGMPQQAHQQSALEKMMAQQSHNKDMSTSQRQLVMAQESRRSSEQQRQQLMRLQRQKLALEQQAQELLRRQQQLRQQQQQHLKQQHHQPNQNSQQRWAEASTALPASDRGVSPAAASWSPVYSPPQSSSSSSGLTAPVASGTASQLHQPATQPSPVLQGSLTLSGLMQPLSSSAGGNASSLWGSSPSLAGQHEQQWRNQQSHQLPPKPQQKPQHAQQMPPLQQQQQQQQQRQQQRRQQQGHQQPTGIDHNPSRSTEDESRFADLLSLVDG